MTGAMYSAIAGLKTHMQNLNVIGNNIANVNTTAYKPGRSVFRTALYTQISSGRNGTTTVGSMNPSQIGYGSNLATVSIDMSTGSFSPGKPTDLTIDGDGFFLMGDKDVAYNIDPTDPNTFTSLKLSRVGDVEFGEDGYLTDGPGNVVYGFLVVGTVDGEPIYSDQLVPIRLPRQDEDGKVVYPHLETDEEAGEDGKLTLVDTLRDPENDDENASDYAIAQVDSITIGTDGIITATMKGTDQVVTIGAIAIGTVTNPNGVTQESASYYKCGQGAGDLSINMLAGKAKDVYVYSGEGPIPDDAVLPTEEEADTGDIVKGMAYVNGSQVEMDDDNGLPEGSRVYDAGTTLLQTGGLELSKTDLATEIANMITTQRGYQANTRIITVTDSMLEELVNMKR